MLGNIYTLVLPEQVTIPQAHAAFNEEGQPKDPALLARVLALGTALANMLVKLGQE